MGIRTVHGRRPRVRDLLQPHSLCVGAGISPWRLHPTGVDRTSSNGGAALINRRWPLALARAAGPRLLHWPAGLEPGQFVLFGSPWHLLPHGQRRCATAPWTLVSALSRSTATLTHRRRAIAFAVVASAASGPGLHERAWHEPLPARPLNRALGADRASITASASSFASVHRVGAYPAGLWAAIPPSPWRAAATRAQQTLLHLPDQRPPWRYPLPPAITVSSSAVGRSYDYSPSP